MSRLAPVICLALAACAARHPEPAATDAALVARGEQAVARLHCAACHDPGDGSLAGQRAPVEGTMAYGTNLTPDPDTGLGDWPDEAIVRALREGLDAEGAPLCPSMPRYPKIADDEAAAIVAYLRALPLVRDDVPASECAMSDAGDAPDRSDGIDAGPSRDAGPSDGAMPAPVDATAAGPVVEDADVPPTATPDAGAPDGAPPRLPPVDGGCTPRLNEVATAGPVGASDEFVELYNPCAAPVDLTGWKIVYRSAAGTVDETLALLGGASLAPGAFLVCGSKRFSGHADVACGGALSSTGGALALRDASGALRDDVAWGTASNVYVRGTAAAAPSDSQSLARHPDGTDSGDASSDFSVGAPTPGATDGP